jgi:hypothetical protein
MELQHIGLSWLATKLKREGKLLKLMASMHMLAFTSNQQNYPLEAKRNPYGYCGSFIALAASALGALMVTDTSFMRNPHYHQMSDTIDTLDLPFFTAVVDGLENALGKL